MTRNTTTSPIKTILIAGLVAGILDGLAAAISFIITSNGKNPIAVYKFVASGVFGKSALHGGWEIGMLGILFHLVIAMIFAVLFYFLYRNIHWIKRNILISGILYGIVVWIIMNKIVVPLSNTPPLPPPPIHRIMISMLILVFCIGLPIALIVQKREKLQSANQKTRD